MKKLVLLVSVFLLLTGLVFADVTFAPAVTGDASVTWGLDLQPNGKDFEKVNSGFAAANNSTFDLGVTIDPFDAMTGEEGMYGEIELTGMAVTAKSGSDVAVTAPTVTAKLYFMESLYMRVCTNPAPEYDVVTPLGNLITVDDNKQEGTWYDSDDGDMGTTVESDWGNAGYGFTYMMDALTVNADFVSLEGWGSADNLVKVEWKAFDTGSVDGEKEDQWLTGLELGALNSAITTATVGTKYTYSAYVTDMRNVAGTDMYFIEVDGDNVQMWRVEVGNTEEGQEVAGILDGTDINDSLYTLGVDVTYAMDGIGTFMAYVLPGHEDQFNTFSKFGYGGKITIDAVDMVTPVLAADFIYDETNGFIGNDKRDILEWEAYAELPVSYEVSEDVSVDAAVKFAATDSSTWAAGNEKRLEERVVYDVYASAGADVMGASLDAAYMVSEAFYEAGMSSSMTVGASYELEAMGGTITPSADWAVDFTDKTKGDEEGYLTVAVAAAVVDNTTFTLKYASGDLLENPYDTDSHDPGVVTFETKIAY